MATLNRVELIGRAGREPEIRTFADSGKMASLSLATTERYKNTDGEVKENTEWHILQMYGKLAETAERLIVKGSLLYVEGKLHNRSYEKDGVTHYVTEVVCNNFQLLGGGKPKDEQPVQQQKGRQNSKPVEAYDDNNGESDLPF